jgi:hypothetical protein
MAEIVLKIEGDGFSSNKYDLRSIEKILTNYRQIIDHLIPLAVGQKTLTDRLKSEVRYEASFKQGSLEIWTDFILPVTGLLANAISEGNSPIIAKYIANLIDNVLTFRRLYTDLLEQGKKPSVGLNIEDRHDTSVSLKNINTGGGDINIGPIILPATTSTRSSIDRLINSIDGKLVERITVKSEDKETKITLDDHRLVGTQKEELPDFIEVYGRLDGIAFDAHKGSLVTASGRFPITWSKEIREKLGSFADKENMAFRARPIIDHREFKKGGIVALHVLNCWDPKDKLL